MRPLLLIIVLVLSGCQSLVGDNNLAIFEADNVYALNYSDDNDLWRVIADRQEIIVDNNPRIQSHIDWICLLYTSPSPRDLSTSRMPSSA